MGCRHYQGGEGKRRTEHRRNRATDGIGEIEVCNFGNSRRVEMIRNRNWPRNGRRILIPLIIPFFFPTIAWGKRCDSIEVAKAETHLPRIMIIRPGQTPKGAINKTLGCEYPYTSDEIHRIKPTVETLIGQRLLNAEGQRIGVITDIIVKKNYQLKSAVVSYSETPGAAYREVMVPISALELRKVGVISPHLLDVKQLEKFPKYQATSWQLSDAELPNQNDVSYKEFLKYVFGRVGQSLGLYPLPYISVHLESKPAGARIYFGENLYGDTSKKLLVHEAEIDTVRFEKVGFVPCKYQDGKLSPTAGRELEYLFHCEMKPLTSK